MGKSLPNKCWKKTLKSVILERRGNCDGLCGEPQDSKLDAVSYALH